MEKVQVKKVYTNLGKGKDFVYSATLPDGQIIHLVGKSEVFNPTSLEDIEVNVWQNSTEVEQLTNWRNKPEPHRLEGRYVLTLRPIGATNALSDIKVIKFRVGDEPNEKHRIKPYGDVYYYFNDGDIHGFDECKNIDKKYDVVCSELFKEIDHCVAESFTCP